MNKEKDYLSIEEDYELFDFLSEHHIIFQTFWSIGKPRFSREISTAAVAFNKSGEIVYMVINPDFWNSLNTFNKAFVIAHECLHVILNHGKRSMYYKDLENVNIAQDIVINEMLVSGFGLNKYDIQNWDKFCFVETVFKSETISKLNIKRDESFEYYLNIIRKRGTKEKAHTVDQHQVVFQSGESGEGKGEGNGLSQDDIDLMEDINSFTTCGNEALDSILEEMSEQLSESEIKDLGDILDRDFKGGGQGNGRGFGGFGKYMEMNIAKRKPSAKWENIVIHEAKSIYTIGKKEKPSWISRDRNHYCLSKELMMQGKWEQKGRIKDKFNLVFFLDASGSCLSYAERFFELLKSIPQKKFQIDAYSFTVKTYEIDIKNGKVVGTGGTKFDILDKKVREITERDGKHPDLIFVITDGMGNRLKPEKPELWHWMLTPFNVKEYIPEKSKTYELKDFT